MKTKLIVLLPFLLLGGVVWGQVDIDTKNNAIESIFRKRLILLKFQ